MLLALKRALRRIACLLGPHYPMLLPETFPFLLRRQDDADVPILDVRCCRRCGAVYWVPALDLDTELQWRGALMRA